MRKFSETAGLTKLGSEGTTYEYQGADYHLLERFPNPLQKGPGLGSVNITAPEFTSLCPMTGQPDFATIVVDYVPREHCVESKAWKIYLGSFRQVGEFHESCIRRMANDLIRLLDPHTLVIEGRFTPRGGIPFWPKIEYDRPAVVLDLGALDLEDPELIKILEKMADSATFDGEILIKKNGYAIAFAYGDEEGLVVSRLDGLDYGDASGISH